MKKVLFLSLFSFQVIAQEWQTLSPTNNCLNRHENSFVAVGNQLVLVGGRGIKPVETFDVKTNIWTQTINTPIEIHHFQAIAYKNELWVVGAFTGKYPHEVPIPNIYIYNLEKKEWREGPQIPKDRQRGAAAAFVHKNKIYILCGITDGHWDGHVAWFDEFDPKTNIWRKLPDAPVARDHVSAAVIDNKVYITAGRKSTAKINQVLNLTEGAVNIFDFKTNQWTSLPESQNVPTHRAGNSTIAFGKKIVIMGGESGSQVPSHSEVEALNTKTLTWEKLPNLQKGRHGTGATVLNGKIYTAAGSGNRGGGPELNSIEVFVEKK